MRISRPCYDKPHRCPGWAGGGMRYAKVDRCGGSGLSSVEMYNKRAWRFRFNSCRTCGVTILPNIIRWFDWRWLAYMAERRVDDLKYRWSRR